MSDEHRPIEAERCDRLSRIVDEGRERVAAPHGIGTAMAALVQRDEAPSVQPCRDARPESRVRGESVKRKDALSWGPGIGGPRPWPLDVVQPRTIVLDPTLARRQRSP